MHLDLQQIVTKLIHQIFRVQFTTTYSRLKKVWHQKTNQDESIIIRNDGAVARRSTKSVFFSDPELCSEVSHIGSSNQRRIGDFGHGRDCQTDATV